MVPREECAVDRFRPALILLAILLMVPLEAAASSRGRPPVEIVTSASYPELRVHGRPFFVHSAAFFYYRIPRDLWSAALDRHRELGLNTIDIYIPWNWHEPAPGQLDFDGHSNPSRDLRGLLRLLRRKGFAVIARPGPVILNEWRNGGYPDWLLQRPEYEMPLGDVLEGRYPPLSGLGTRNAEKAAQAWINNRTHLRSTRRWFVAVGAELARFRREGGVLLAVQLDDDQAIGRTNVIGPAFWRYLETLRRYLADGFRQAGARRDVPVFFNPTDPRLPAAGFDPALPAPIAVMGQWYEDRPRTPALKPARLDSQDHATLQFFAETLALQPAFPPMIIEFQAGWYAPGDDAAPLRTDPRNTLIASRLLLAHGLRGLNYFPAEDTLTPAGYEVPWANRSYAWDAALRLDGRTQPRAAALRRNGELLRAVGTWLAATHKQADFGLVYPLSSFDQSTLTPEDVLAVSRLAMRLTAMAASAGLESSYLDPEYEPEGVLARHQLLLLPVFDGTKFAMSERAAQRVESYVRRGGRLALFPRLPDGPVFARMFAEAGLKEVEQEVITRRKYGAGELIFLPAAMPPGEKTQAGKQSPILEGGWLKQIFETTGGQPALRVEVRGVAPERVDATLLRSDGSVGWGFVALTNTDYDSPARIRLEARDPRGQEMIDPGELILPAADSLFLPVRLPLCTWGKTCEEELFSATAELTGLYAEEGELVTSWYVPNPAVVSLRLAERPESVSLDGRAVPFDFNEATKLLHISLPAGSGPLYGRELRVATGYEWDLPALPQRPGGDVTIEIPEAISFPVGEGVKLASRPPLVPIAGEGGSLTLVVRNRTERARRLEVRLVAPELEPQRSVHLEAGPFSSAEAVIPVRFRDGVRPGLHRARLTLASKTLPDRSLSLALRKPGEALAYSYDLDRDGSPDWVLENDELRAVVSPAAGARSFVLEDKRSGLNWFTNAGGLRDHFVYYLQPEGINPQRRRGQYGLHNRPYRCEVAGPRDGERVRLRCQYVTPDVLPAGARVVKTITLEGHRLAAVYEIHLDTDGEAAGRPAQAFLNVASLPADATTSFGPDASLEPAGAAVEISGNALRIERPNSILMLRFDGAKATLERKVFSFWLKMAYPPLAAGNGYYHMEYEVQRPR